MNTFARKSKSKGSQEKKLRLDSSNSEVPAEPKQTVVVADDSDEEEIFTKKRPRRNKSKAESKSSEDDEFVAGSKKRKSPLDAYKYKGSEESTPVKRRKGSARRSGSKQKSDDAECVEIVDPAPNNLDQRRSKLNKIAEASIEESRSPARIKSNAKKASQGPDDVDDDLFEGKRFAVTGVFNSISRDEIEKFVTRKAGRVTSAVSGVTDYLIAGAKLEDGREVNTSGKYRKAEGLKVKILSEQDLEGLIRKLSGLEKFTFCGDFLDEYAGTLEGDEGAKSPLDKPKTGLEHHEMWTDTYKPLSITQIVGNQGVVKQLLEWLRDWDDVVIRGNKKQVASGNRFNRNAWVNMPNPNARAVLVSGPPGIGKTSAVRIVCRQLGFEMLEMNASDVRSKTAILGNLSTLSGNQSIDYFTATGRQKMQSLSNNPTVMAFGGHHKKKSVIVMDEVDGCGAGDRGGIAALITMIKQSKVPIICICNDRQSRKIVSLVNHCYDLKFHRPTPDMIQERLLAICEREKLKADKPMLKKLIESSGSDLRQIINVLQMWKNQSASLGANFMSTIGKDEKVMLNNFDAASRLLNLGDHKIITKYKTYRSKLDLFFIDHEFVPLLVQENYLNAQMQAIQKRGGRVNNADELRDLESMAEASDCLSCSDIVSTRIRRDMIWSLLPDFGTLSSVAPSLVIKGAQPYPTFPQLLGKFSSLRKHKRLQRELKQALSLKQTCVSPDYYSVQAGFVPLLLHEVMNRFKKNDIDGLLEYLDDMSVTNEMIKEHLLCLDLSGDWAAKFEKIEPKTKAAFTRAYNKMKEGFKRTGGKGKATKDTPNPEDVESEPDVASSDDEEVLMDEDQIAEIKAAKKAEKEREKAARTLKKLEKHQQKFQSKHQINLEEDEKPSPKKGKGGKSTTKKAAEPKPAKKDKKETEKKTKKDKDKKEKSPKKGGKKGKKAADEDQKDAGGGLQFF